ncbi:MAG: YvcK family protein [Desulfobacula sp.]|jgi:uncharacterized cofD-like protein|nr:YvcK family protein [Desulfobacula sp.]
MDIKEKNIVTIGGGSGQFILLSGLRDLENIRATAIVSMVDSGGSTGRLRDELGILPPGDIIKCLLALSPYQAADRCIMLKRFKGDPRLAGHSAGNMLLTMLSRYTGDFPASVAALAEILEVDGTILPVTIDRATLVAELSDGKRIFGEQAIDLPRGKSREQIKDIFLVPHHHGTISVHPPVLDAIEKADYIFIGPGDLYTSIIPNLIVPGVRQALQNTSAKIYFTINIMTKFGETHNFSGKDFAIKIEDCLELKIDGFIGNITKPTKKILDSYAKQNSDFVSIDMSDPFWNHRNLHLADMLDTTAKTAHHDPKKLAQCIVKIMFEYR